MDAYFVSIPAFLLAMPSLIQTIKVKLKLKGTKAKLLSWGFGLVIGYIAYFTKLGVFADLAWWHTGLVGIGSALIANGLYSHGVVVDVLEKAITYIEVILNWIGKKKQIDIVNINSKKNKDGKIS